MSGLLISSRGGRNDALLPELEGSCEIWRDHGLCLQGNKTSKSFLRTYALETLK